MATISWKVPKNMFSGRAGAGSPGSRSRRGSQVTMLSLDELLEVLLGFLLHDGFTGPDICRWDNSGADTFLFMEGGRFTVQENKNFFRQRAGALLPISEQIRALFGTSLVVQWLTFPMQGGTGSIPGQLGPTCHN